MKYQLLGTNINYLVKNNILEIPDYIKIDVDGIEHLILLGGDMYLKDPKIKSILIEINENFKDQHSSILKIMKEKNFKFYNKYKAYNADKIKNFLLTFNYIFIKNLRMKIAFIIGTFFHKQEVLKYRHIIYAIS